MATIQQKVVHSLMKILRGAALKALLFLAVIGLSGNVSLLDAQSHDGKKTGHQHDRVLQLNFEARALQDRGLLDDAEATFREALSIFPDNIETNIGIARILAQTGRSGLARKHLSVAREKIAEGAHAHEPYQRFVLGRAYIAADMAAEARKQFNRALTMAIASSDHVLGARVHLALATLISQADEFSGADKHFADARDLIEGLERSNELKTLWLSDRADHYIRMGKLKAAMTTLGDLRVLSTSPLEQALVDQRVGMILYSLDEVEGAALLLADSIERLEAILDDAHPVVQTAKKNHQTVLDAMGSGSRI